MMMMGGEFVATCLHNGNRPVRAELGIKRQGRLSAIQALSMPEVCSFTLSQYTQLVLH